MDEFPQRVRHHRVLRLDGVPVNDELVFGHTVHPWNRPGVVVPLYAIPTHGRKEDGCQRMSTISKRVFARSVGKTRPLTNGSIRVAWVVWSARSAENSTATVVK